MKRFLLAASLMILAAPALADTLEVMKTNTVTTALTDGAITRWHFNADGTFAMTAPDGTQGGGAYRTTADQLCLTMTGATEEVCVAAPPADKNVGDTWQTQGADGAAMTVSIVAGR